MLVSFFRSQEILTIPWFWGKTRKSGVKISVVLLDYA